MHQLLQLILVVLLLVVQYTDAFSLRHEHARRKHHHDEEVTIHSTTGADAHGKPIPKHLSPDIALPHGAATPGGSSDGSGSNHHSTEAPSLHHYHTSNTIYRHHIYHTKSIIPDAIPVSSEDKEEDNNSNDNDGGESTINAINTRNKSPSSPSSSIRPTLYEIPGVSKGPKLTHRQLLRHLIRQRRDTFPVAPDASVKDIIPTEQWHSFVCDVCKTFASELSRSTNEGTMAYHPSRIVEMAVVNVTDFYTYSLAERKLKRTRSEKRWENKPYTDKEKRLRKVVTDMLDLYFLNQYDRDVFFHALHTASVHQRPPTLPAPFIVDEYCVKAKRVCPRARHADTTFKELRSGFELYVQQEEHAQAAHHPYIKELWEERELEREAIQEEEEEKVMLTKKRMGNTGGTDASSVPALHPEEQQEISRRLHEEEMRKAEEESNRRIEEEQKGVYMGEL